MGEENRRTVEWGPWIGTKEPAPGEKFSFNTQHLPTEVVAQEYTFAIEMVTNPENQREGGVWFALRLGGRDNPALTSEERDYVVTSIDACLAAIAAGQTQPAPPDDSDSSTSNDEAKPEPLRALLDAARRLPKPSDEDIARAPDVGLREFWQAFDAANMAAGVGA